MGLIKFAEKVLGHPLTAAQKALLRLDSSTAIAHGRRCGKTELNELYLEYKEWTEGFLKPHFIVGPSIWI